MPIYEYECKKCHHRFERIQKFSDPPIKKCPKCNSRVEKQLSSPAVHFKGSGWYVTDYARKGSSGGKEKDKNGKEAKDGKKGEGGGKESGGSGDSKPAGADAAGKGTSTSKKGKKS